MALGPAYGSDGGGGGGSGDVTKVGTPANNQVAVWTGNGTAEGAATLTYDGTALAVTGNITVTGTVDGRDLAADGTALDAIAGAAEGTIYGRPTGGTQGHNTVASYLPDLRSGTNVQLTLSMSNIEAGSIAFYLIPEGLTIAQVDGIADVVGDLVLDLWSGAGVPTVADTITAAAKPTWTADQIMPALTLTGWTTSLVGGEYLAVHVDSATTITGCTLTITCAVA